MKKNSIGQPLIVAIETSGRLGSAALACGEKLLAQRDFSAPMRHSSELFPAVEELLSRFGHKPSEIKQVYLSIGPGSFTGLRIAATFAKTLALANSARIVAVSTSDVIISNVIDSTAEVSEGKPNYERLATILDAKRGQFFVAGYDRIKDSAANAECMSPMKGYEKTLVDCLMTAEEFLERFSDSQSATGLLGEGLVYYADRFKAAGIEIIHEKYWWPRASEVHRLGWSKAVNGDFTEPFALQPLYLRQPQLGVSRMRTNK